MKHPLRGAAALAIVLGAVLAGAAAANVPAADPALAHAIADPARTPKFVARDRYRHPAEELAFFGLKPGMTVVEIWPGAGYWTEILGPYLKSSGHYIAAVTVSGESKEEDATTDAWKQRMAREKDKLGPVTLTELGKGHFEVAPAGSADLIVTFRNLHNWMDSGYAEQALQGFFTALKPGGILGIEDHRARAGHPQDPKAKSGYVRQDYAIELARKAGFEFVGASEVAANPKDTTDWPEGVWTL
ncbi:MAG TPA: hypothetical protein VLX90_15105, partial [Steroidobacteraceae bacterium]|nr:hypothetical protein [Steroidobacteraceae bacterium]